MRKALSLAGMALLALGLSGCISIKSNTASQRAPGVVTVAAEVCASDYDASFYAACRPAAGLFAQDNIRFDAESTGVDGQLLVGYRVPVGAEAPDSFQSDNAAVVFTRNPSYTSELQRLLPAPAGEQWFGYVSTLKHYNRDDPATRTLAFKAEFTLPRQADGGLFAGPFRWRMVVGLRGGDPAADVTCGNNPASSFCLDSPPPATIATNEEKPVSDFAVQPGGSVTANRGATATVAFPLTYADAGAIGAQTFALEATTNLPGANATPAQPTLNAAQNSTNTVNVSVAVPAGTPAGTYEVRLSAATGAPAITRTSTATIVVPPPPPPSPVDTEAPVVAGFTVSRERFRFRLSEAASVRIAIARAKPGRRVGRSCRTPTRRLRNRRRCTRFVTVGTLSRRNLRAGANSVPVPRRLRGRRLRVGRYRATIVATDRAGNRSRPKRKTFRRR